MYFRLLLWAFERLYHEFAWAYDSVAAVVSRGYWPAWTTTAVPFLRGHRVLELGCGTGHLQAALARAGITHVGYDASRSMLRVARRRLDRMRLWPRLLCGMAQSLPFASGSFSDVVATFPAPYIVNSSTLNEITRVLQPDGRLIIVDGGMLQKQDLLDATLDLATRATQAKEATARYDIVLRRAGFAISWRKVVVEHSIVMVGVAERGPHADAGA